MTTELFANNAAFQLASGCANTDTSLVLNSTVPAALQAAGQWRALITDSNGSEYVIIPGGQAGPTVTGVTRGAEGTTATGHSQGSWVTHIVTAGAILNSIGSAVTVGAVTDFLLGRTGVLGSAADSAPASASTVYITDAPWGAKCDAKTVTDGAITSGSNILFSATATFAVGQVVVVKSAGPTVIPGGSGTPSVPGVLIGWVTSVGAGTATLMTTKGGSTPANASNTVASGGTVRFGSDDTAAIQAAMNAASAAATTLGGASNALGLVHFPENRATMITTSLNPVSNVMLWMYGATLYLATGNTTTSNTNSMMFRPATNVSVSNFHLRGGTFPGNGSEAGTAASLAILYMAPNAFGQNGSALYTDISVMDATVTNYASAAWDIRGGCQRIRVSNNVCRNVTSGAGTNVINIIMNASNDYADVLVQNNIILGAGAECIAIGEGSTPTGNFNRGIISGNICQTTGDIGGAFSAACIDLEWSTVTTGGGHTMMVNNNICVNTLAASSSWCIAAGASAAGNNVVGQVSGVSIENNLCVGVGGGILIESVNDCNVSGNVIVSNQVAASTQNPILVITSGNTIVTPTQTTPGTTLDNIVGSQTNVVNGSQINGTNIPGGAYIVSGAGTSTWIISLPTTVVATTAVTVRQMVRNVSVTNNVIRSSNTLTRSLLQLDGVRDSVVKGNIITLDPGNTTVTATNGNSIYLFNCGWCEVEGNKVTYAATAGIQIDRSNDCHALRNRIYNASDTGSALSSGIVITNQSGTSCRVDGNTIIDDRAVHLQSFGVNGSSLNGVPIYLINNEIRGVVTASAMAASNFALIKNNIFDTTYPSVTLGTALAASPASYPATALSYPAVVYFNGGTATLVQHVRSGSSTRTVWSGAGVAISYAAVYLQPGDQALVTYTVAPNGVIEPIQ